MRLTAGEPEGRFLERLHWRLLAVGKMVVGQVLADTQRLEGSGQQLKAVGRGLGDLKIALRGGGGGG